MSEIRFKRVIKDKICVKKITPEFFLKVIWPKIGLKEEIQIKSDNYVLKSMKNRQTTHKLTLTKTRGFYLVIYHYRHLSHNTSKSNSPTKTSKTPTMSNKLIELIEQGNNQTLLTQESISIVCKKKTSVIHHFTCIRLDMRTLTPVFVKNHTYASIDTYYVTQSKKYLVVVTTHEKPFQYMRSSRF